MTIGILPRNLSQHCFLPIKWDRFMYEHVGSIQESFYACRRSARREIMLVKNAQNKSF